VKIGSLFSGYGGLDAGVQAVIGGELAWHCEWDAAPSKILEHHFPDIPNFRDVSLVDFTKVPPVDVLTGGFPCQDVSLAGRRAGMKDGTRSGLWSEFARAIDELKPSLVVIENVRGLLSAHAASDVEPCSWCLGDDSGEPALRALGAVLGDLADLGYDAEWFGVRAADAGAPHGRFRVFIVAQPSVRYAGHDAGYAELGVEPEAASGGLGEPGAVAAQDADVAVGGEWWQSASGQAEGGRAWADAGRRGGALVADSDCVGWDGRAEEPGRGTVLPAVAGDWPASPYTDGGGLWSLGRIETHQRDPDRRNSQDTAWGDYEPAIRRWETMTARVAPAPTLPDGKNGNHRLNARFVEWMMGLPDGWVTSREIGLTRNEQLKALGNGVVPQQAAMAMRTLLGPS
jgi:DNA (cytosine-5)-methyltransferase 1